jgi:endonuclease/exonuclease/phosphatase family metal-dependent hydrolase
MGKCVGESKEIDLSEKPSFVNYLMSLILKSGTNVFLLIYLLSFFNSRFLVSEILCHFQVFYLGCAVFGLTLGLLLKKIPYILVHLLVTIYILCLILPFYFKDSAIRKEEPILKVFQSNVEKINSKYELVVKQVEANDPDVVLLIETNSEWDKGTISLQKKYSYNHKLLIGAFGYIFYSKIPIKSIQVRDFETNYNCLDILLSWEGKDIRFIAAHPPPPVNGEVFKIRNQHLLKYAELINEQKNIPTIVCGDLNITPWSSSYNRLIDQAKLKSTRQGFGLLPSWPSWLPYHIPIDHCLLTQHFGIANTQVMPSVNSDHLPMLSEIFLIK